MTVSHLSGQVPLPTCCSRTYGCSNWSFTLSNTTRFVVPAISHELHICLMWGVSDRFIFPAIILKISLLAAGEIGGAYYGSNHPMKPHRICMAHHLILGYGLHRHMEVFVSPFLLSMKNQPPLLGTTILAPALRHSSFEKPHLRLS